MASRSRTILACVAACLIVVAAASATPGDLDPTFGTGGKLTTTFGPAVEEATAVALQPDGKIVAAGYHDLKFALARYNLNGSLDPTFDGDGKVITPVGAGNNDQAWAIALQPDGKIIAAGQSSNGANADFALVRYNANGSLDTTFDGDGIVTTAVGAGDDELWALTLQPDGKLVAAGSSSNGTDRDLALVRYNANGSLDTTFDGDGKVTTAVGSTGDDVAYGVKLQPDGKIVAAGSASNGANADIAVVRYGSDGSLDTTFDGDGKVTTPIGTFHDEVFALALQADGKIVAAGYGSDSTPRDFALVRYRADGGLDPTFDGDGKVRTSFAASGDDQAWALGVQPDGKLVAVGQALGNAGSSYDFALARYETDGSLDAGFGAGGNVIRPIGAGASDDFGYAVALQPDGTLVVAGSAVDFHTTWALARFLADGTPPVNAALTSASHTVGVWSTDPTVDVSFAGASDEWSGLDGFSFLWDESPSTVPDTVKDAEETAAETTSPSLADGTRYLHLRTADVAGNWSGAVHLGPFSIDTTAPEAGEVAAFAPFQKASSFTVGWSARDAASGVADYEVRYRRAPLAGGFRPAVIWRTGEIATGAPFTALPGSTYCLSARARDAAGNQGGFGGEACTAVPAGARALIRKGSWLRQRSYLVSRHRGDSLSLRVSAKRLVLVATKCRGCGVVDVYLGARRLKRIRLGASTTRKNQLLHVATFAGVRTGTVRIVIASKRRPVLVEGLGASRV